MISHLTAEITTTTTTKMNNSSPANLTLLETDRILYRTLAQGIFILCISTVLGSVMALFICLNIVSECKVSQAV